jgi:hypothetical protein
MNIRSANLPWVICIGLAIATAETAFAHHSFGMFDMQKTLTIEGAVKEFQWTNPHIWIDVIVADSSTNAYVLCSVEGDAIAMQTRKGWTRNSLKAGDKVTLVIHPLRKGSNGGSLVSANVNGKVIGNPELKAL